MSNQCSGQERRARRQSGRAMLETGLVLIPLMIMLLAIVDLGMALFLKASFEHAAREGARYAITYRTEGGLGQDRSIKNVVVRNSMGFLRESNVSVTFYDKDNPLNAIPSPGGNAPDNLVEVSVSGFSWSWIIPFFMTANPSFPITARSADRMEALPANGVAPPR